MDLQILMPWLVAANTIIALATALYASLTSGAKQAAKDLEDYRKKNDLRVDDARQRLQALEADMRHLPDRDHAHRMELAIERLTSVTQTLEAQLSGRMDTLDERLKPVASISSRLQEFLLEQAKR